MVWNETAFDLVEVASTNEFKMDLRSAKAIPVSLAAVPGGGEFFLKTEVRVEAVDCIAGETGIWAYIQDPLEVEGGKRG